MEQVPDSDSSSSIKSAGRHLLAKPAPKAAPKPAHKPVLKPFIKPAHKPIRAGPKSSDKAAPTKVALLASSSTTVQTSGKQGGTGTNSLKAVFKTFKGTAQGTVVSAESQIITMCVLFPYVSEGYQSHLRCKSNDKSSCVQQFTITTSSPICYWIFY